MTTELSTSPLHADPQKEHHWLDRLVGDWTFEAEAGEPGSQPEKAGGTETVRSLGGLWTLAEAQGELPGGGIGTSLMTLGYDPQRKRYVGTWVGSMMAHLWIYEGTLDETTGVLTLDSEGPGMDGDGLLAKYRDTIEFRSNDHRVLTSHVLDEEGEWQPFMTADYRRLK
jgi:hypothetical protein